MITSFICGAIFGMVVCLAASLVATQLMNKPKLVPNKKDPVPEVQSQERYAASIAMQWQNIAAYDGTDNGQRDIET